MKKCLLSLALISCGVYADNSVVVSQTIVDADLHGVQKESVSVVNPSPDKSPVIVGAVRSSLVPQSYAPVKTVEPVLHREPVKTVEPVFHSEPANKVGKKAPMLDAKPVKTVAIKLADNTDLKDSEFVRDGNFRSYPSTGKVEFELHTGLLKPQLIELLLHHPAIRSVDSVQWQVSDNYTWPNTFVVSGKNIDYVINHVLAPYDLLATFTGNGNVIIKKLN